jgi:hypothetical protein
MVNPGYKREKPEILNEVDKSLEKYNRDPYYKLFKNQQITEETRKRYGKAVNGFEKNFDTIKPNQEYSIDKLEYIFNMRWDGDEGLKNLLLQRAKLETTENGKIIVEKTQPKL